MDPKLAEFYGTNEITETDTEKLAAAQMAEKLAEGEEEMSFEGYSEEELEALAQEVLAVGNEQVEEEEETTLQASADDEAPAITEPEKTASAEEEEEVPVSKEKFAEADYLGRVMAHAYVQELRKIEETEKTAGIKDIAGKGAAKAKEMGGKVGNFMKKHPKKSIAGGVGLAAVGGGAAYASGKKKKASAEQVELSALDTLAQARALEILQENGIELEAQSEEVVEEKTASDEGAEQLNALAAAVDERAVAMLQELGYEFEDESEETEQE